MRPVAHPRACGWWGSRLSWPQKRRPGRLALRMACAAALGVAAVVISGWSPGVVGALAGGAHLAARDRPARPRAAPFSVIAVPSAADSAACVTRPRRLVRRGARLGAGGDRAGGVGDPVGPGADVEGGGEARQAEREGLVGGGDAGAAVDADLGCAGHAEAANRAARSAAGRKVPSGLTFSVVGALTAPGMCRPPGRRARSRPGSAPRAGVEQQAGPGQRGRAVGVEQRQVAGGRGEVPSGGPGRRDARGPGSSIDPASRRPDGPDSAACPAAVQARKPPSSTRTERWPK